MPPLAGQDDTGRQQALVTFQTLADRIGVVEFAGGNIDHRGFTDAANLERAQLRPADRFRGVYGGKLDDGRQIDAEAEELRHRGQEIEGRALDGDRMDVGRNDIW